MEVRLLGPVEFGGVSGESISIPGNKTRGLLAVLALDVGAVVTPQRLMDVLWGEQEVSGPNVVQVIVSKLRRALADGGEIDRIVTRSAGYQLQIEREGVDALRFEALVDQARELRDDPRAACDALRQALELWRGAALGGVPDTELISAMRSRLEELHRVAVEDLVEAELALGRHARLVPELEALVAAEPLRERRWGLLIRAL